MLFSLIVKRGAGVGGSVRHSEAGGCRVRAYRVVVRAAEGSAVVRFWGGFPKRTEEPEPLGLSQTEESLELHQVKVPQRRL